MSSPGAREASGEEERGVEVFDDLVARGAAGAEDEAAHDGALVAGPADVVDQSHALARGRPGVAARALDLGDRRLDGAGGAGRPREGPGEGPRHVDGGDVVVAAGPRQRDAVRVDLREDDRRRRSERVEGGLEDLVARSLAVLQAAPRRHLEALAPEDDDEAVARHGPEPPQARLGFEIQRKEAVVVLDARDQVRAGAPVLVGRGRPQTPRHAPELGAQLRRELAARADDAAGVDQRSDLDARERLHELVARRRRAREGLLADVAVVLALVFAVEHGVRRLRHEHHPLPPTQAVEVDPLLAPATRARRDELALLLAVEAVPAQLLVVVVVVLLLLLLHHGWRRRRQRCRRDGPSLGSLPRLRRGRQSLRLLADTLHCKQNPTAPDEPAQGDGEPGHARTTLEKLAGPAPLNTRRGSTLSCQSTASTSLTKIY